jgi:hypothetical protein|nr:MAG TPA: hypothetical protein [Caudoviricetes sp.]
MPNHPNNYANMGLTGKNPRKQEKTTATVLAVPFIYAEGHEHGEDPSKKLNRINDQVKAGKRRGAMILTDAHGLMVASGSKETDLWFTHKFPEETTIIPS